MSFFVCSILYTTCVPGACEGQKRASDPSGVELQFLAAMWVLGMEPRSSGIAARALDY